MRFASFRCYLLTYSMNTWGKGVSTGNYLMGRRPTMSYQLCSQHLCSLDSSIRIPSAPPYPVVDPMSDVVCNGGAYQASSSFFFFSFFFLLNKNKQ